MPEASEPLVQLAGSERAPLPGVAAAGFIDAISEAVQATPAPIAISISWGQSEDSWTAQGRSAMDAAMADAAALGITVCVASGGTSAVAPLWAALISRLAEASGQRFGLIQTLLYAGVAPGTAVPGFRDITSGNNGAYAAGPGWDACSGLGSPDGTALLNRLQGSGPQL